MFLPSLNEEEIQKDTHVVLTARIPYCYCENITLQNWNCLDTSDYHNQKKMIIFTVFLFNN